MAAGDARSSLQHELDLEGSRHFDILVVDTFSSDSIPVHLLTAEALALYQRKMTPDGLMAFNISNRYLDLRPIAGDLAGSLGLACIACLERITVEAKLHGYDSAEWALLARDERPLRALLAEGRWDRVLPRAKPVVWTDDSSDILSAFVR